MSTLLSFYYKDRRLKDAKLSEGNYNCNNT